MAMKKIQNLDFMKIGNIKSDGDIADYIVILNDAEIGKEKGFRRSKGA